MSAPTQPAQTALSEKTPLSVGLAFLIGAPVIANLGMTWSNRTTMAVIEARLDSMQAAVERIDRTDSQRIRDLELEVAALKQREKGD